MFGASRTAGALAVIIAGLLTLPAAAMAAEEGAPPPSLEVTTRSRYEPEIPSEPGKTELDIQATFGWDVRVTVRARGVIVLSEESPIEEADEFNSGPGVLHISFVSWSCRLPPPTGQREFHPTCSTAQSSRAPRRIVRPSSSLSTGRASGGRFARDRQLPGIG